MTAYPALTNHFPLVVIPAYQPDATLLTLIDELLPQLQARVERDYYIIVVNDGSDTDTQSLFTTLAQRSGVKLLTHAQNKGKGAALKTAIDWQLQHYSDHPIGLVTADADGQHLPQDIVRIAEKLQHNPATLWLGCRQFDQQAIPWRSRFGNQLTLKCFKWCTGATVSDTQTGLRGIPHRYLAKLTELPQDGYEFEFEMLLRARREQVRIGELTITTVYQPGNPTSHFQPIRDSIRIYSRFLSFAGVGMLSAVLDYAVFALLLGFFHHLFWAVAGARFISGVFNFCGNRRFVFEGKGHWGVEAGKYLALALTIMGLSYSITWSFEELGLTPFIGKIIAEALAVFCSYTGQRLLVFRSQSSQS